MLQRYAPQTKSVTVLEDWAVHVNFSMTQSSGGSPAELAGAKQDTATDPLDMPDSEWDRIYNFGLTQNFSQYLTNTDLQRKLSELRATYADIISLKQIGNTQANQGIVGMEMTGYHSNSSVSKPRVALFGGLHGSQPVGRELLWRLAQHLGEGEIFWGLVFIQKNNRITK